MTRRATETRARLQAVALDLFEEHGYRAVTVEQIAAAAGVSHMTFFRCFPAKERVLLEDFFDPVIAEAVRAQPEDAPAIERVCRGLLGAAAHLDDGLSEAARRGIAIAAGLPELQAGMAANTAATVEAIVSTAATPGGEHEMRVAAAACLAAVHVALVEWVATPRDRTLGEAVTDALVVVLPGLRTAEPA